MQASAAPRLFSASTLKHEQRSVRTASGMTCNVCKGVAMCQDCRAWKAPKEFRSEQVVCKRCQKIKCSSCDTHIAPLDFHVDDRRNYFSHNRNVRCKLCKTKGLVGKGNNTYKTCSSCGLSLAALAFRGSRGGTRQDTCKECELVRCAACSVEKTRAQFDVNSAKNFFSHHQNVVCNTCKGLGCSSRDTQRYRCKGACGKLLGHQKFNFGSSEKTQSGRSTNIVLQCVYQVRRGQRSFFYIET